MNDRVPDIYIIGTQKSGTTTLFDWLAQHPDVYAHAMSKDYPYYSDDRTYQDGPKLFYSFSKNATENQVVLGGEANAMYAPLGPSRMYEIMPHARLIVVLRSPVDRAFSAYCYAVERLMENRSLEQAINDELAGLKYKVEDALQLDYLAHGQYAQQLKNIYQLYSSLQVKVVIFEELIQEPLKVVGEIFRFIDVSDDFIPDMGIKNKTKGGYRSKLLAKLIHGRPSSKIVRSLGRMFIPYWLRTGFRRKLVGINRVDKPKPEFSEDIVQLLIEYYKEEVVELQSLLGRDILFWHND